MVQRIFVELLLFLTPFMVFLVYRAASRDMLIKDRWPLTTLVLIGTGLAAAALIITPLLEPSESTKCFQAAQYVDGKVIPSKEIECAQAQQPGALTGPTTTTTTPSTTPTPVAPRDRGN
jgi:hypothetical protein